MNATAKGENMSFKTFKQAVDHSCGIVLGGGEPTIHPRFNDFLMYALAHCDFVTVITNGSMTDTALALARLNCEELSAELSQDAYHDPIDERVVKAFEKIGQIRNTTARGRIPIKAGRCDWGREECICDGDPFVKPNGDVHQCGCDDSPKVGHISDELLEPIDNPYNEWLCHKEIKKAA
jgi:MoaA/NifB/PqqE/SkfB family radical SAM enzyme